MGRPKTVRAVDDLRPIAFTTAEIPAAEQFADSLCNLDPVRPDDDTWVLKARCKDVDPDTFHPASDTDDQRINTAIVICAACPVKLACRNKRYDIGAVGSVWGGVYYGHRARGERPCSHKGCTNKVKAARAYWCGYEHEHAAKVGTRAGYQLHRKNRVPVCKACAEGQYRERMQYGPATHSERGVRSETAGNTSGVTGFHAQRVGRRVAV